MSGRILDDAPAPLELERPLVLQPAPVIGHAPDLLSVVVRHRVLGRRRARVDAVFSDPGEELLFFLYEKKSKERNKLVQISREKRKEREKKGKAYGRHLGHVALVDEPEDGVAEERADEPAERAEGDGE